MKELFTKEILDKHIRENFLRIREILKEFEDEFTLFQVPNLSTNARDALIAKPGRVIFNTTSSKFQGYNGSAWVDLN